MYVYQSQTAASKHGESVFLLLMYKEIRDNWHNGIQQVVLT